MQLKEGSRLRGGDYIIVRSLGQGGFGINYLAEQTNLGRKVAIKEFFMKGVSERDSENSMVSVSNVENEEMASRCRGKFLKEARSIASLEHKGIVPIYDVFEENGTAYYVMKYYSGGSLADKVASTALSQAEAVRYIRQIADAVSFVHCNNMMHLDIKPANILLDNDGSAVLIDFGLAKQYDSQGMQTSTTPVGISHGYAPLEQYRQGGVSNFSPPTDIYSLGATFYKLVTGQKPPEASDVNDDGLSALPSEISPCIRAAIEAAMQPRRKDRPQSIKEFLEILGDAGEPQHSISVSTSLSDEVTRIGDFNIPHDDVAVKRNGNAIDLNIKGVDFRMVAVEGGIFYMGEKKKWYQSSDNEMHEVTLDSYYIGETVVTQALWTAVMGSDISELAPKSVNPELIHEMDKAPMCYINYRDCIKFMNKLNGLVSGKIPGDMHFCFPTEAEWEFAARGGNASSGFRFSGSNNADEVAWHSNNSSGKMQIAKSKRPNELKLYNMSGNVWEWCHDSYEKYPRTPQANPCVEGDVGSQRVVRGGSWGSHYDDCSVTVRYDCYPDRRDCYLGLRLVLK